MADVERVFRFAIGSERASPSRISADRARDASGRFELIGSQSGSVFPRFVRKGESGGGLVGRE